MKKLLLSFAVIFLFYIYSLFNNSKILLLSVNNVSPTVFPSLTPDTRIVQSDAYKDGSYIGSVADAFYGNIQVKAIIQNGKIVDTQFLQYPSDRSRSIEINSQAIPILTSEAIQAQNANVDIVSGATDSSQAFIQSLSSALLQAK